MPPKSNKVQRRSTKRPRRSTGPRKPRSSKPQHRRTPASRRTRLSQSRGADKLPFFSQFAINFLQQRFKAKARELIEEKGGVPAKVLEPFITSQFDGMLSKVKQVQKYFESIPKEAYGTVIFIILVLMIMYYSNKKADYDKQGFPEGMRQNIDLKLEGIGNWFKGFVINNKAKATAAAAAATGGAAAVASAATGGTSAAKSETSEGGESEKGESESERTDSFKDYEDAKERADTKKDAALEEAEQDKKKATDKLKKSEEKIKTLTEGEPPEKPGFIAKVREYFTTPTPKRKDPKAEQSSRERFARAIRRYKQSRR